MQQVTDWEPGDLTAGLGAGLTLAETARILAEQGQQLPIDAPNAEQATLGGLVATNTTGPRRWAFGGWRDLIIGMEMALADGSVIKSGGRVVKNVQGYDLAKLFVGSLGTLGLIGRINVKLVPLPPVRRLLVARGSRHEVCSAAAAVAASQARVTAIDVLDGAAAALCGCAGAPYAAFVLLEGRQAVVDAQALAVQRLAAEQGAAVNALEGDAVEPAWRAWVDLGRVDDLDQDEALLTVPALPGDVEDAIAALEQAAEEHELERRVWARAGNGTVYARLRASRDAAASLAATQGRLLDRWHGTTLTAGVPHVAQAGLPWGRPPATLAVMQAIKQRFDPTGTLNPGRFVGGI